MASKWKFSFAQCSSIGRNWSVRSLQVKFLNMVWVDSTAVGRIAVSTPMAEMMGSATVREHLPMQEISWIVTIRFMMNPQKSFFRSRISCKASAVRRTALQRDPILPHSALLIIPPRMEAGCFRINNASPSI